MNVSNSIEIRYPNRQFIATKHQFARPGRQMHDEWLTEQKFMRDAWGSPAATVGGYRTVVTVDKIRVLLHEIRRIDAIFSASRSVINVAIQPERLQFHGTTTSAQTPSLLLRHD